MFLHQFGVVIGVVNLHASSSGLPACTTLNLQAMKINNTIIDIITEIPYATVNDICNGKTRLEKCSAETVYRLAHALNVSMEELLAPCFIKRSSFENFKSTVCHRVKELGDINFIIDTLESQDIRTYYNRKWYPESLYLLAMLDYLSRESPGHAGLSQPGK